MSDQANREQPPAGNDKQDSPEPAPEETTSVDDIVSAVEVKNLDEVKGDSSTASMSSVVTPSNSVKGTF
jgi:hypothetical protein